MSHRSRQPSSSGHSLWSLFSVLAVGCIGVAGCDVAYTGRAAVDDAAFAKGGGDDGSLRGSVMDTPIPKPALVLTDTGGEAFDLRARTDGYLTLLFFGYTNCPDVCPVHMATLGAAFRELVPEMRERIKVVFVTTDPERDTPERLRTWLDGFDRSFVGLSGPIADINQALASMMLPAVAVIPGESHGPPQIGHPAAIVAFSPSGDARVRYTFGVRQADWAHDIPILLES